MPVLQFPTLEDRTHIHNLISHYAHGKCSRNDLMHWIAHIIKKYNVERLQIFGYSVRILSYYGDLPIISIESSTITESCPTCYAETSAARYLRTEKENLSQDHDLVSVTCLECGCVYIVKSPNGRKNSNAGR